MARRICKREVLIELEPSQQVPPKPKRHRNVIEVEEEEPDYAEEATHVVVKRRNLPKQKSAKSRGELRLLARQKELNRRAELDYTPPPLDLLTPTEAVVGGEDDEELRRKSGLIESKLKDFGIAGRVTEVHPGPVITLFEFEPAPGVKVGRIAALQDDLAMSLRATSIRIIAPIPRKGTVGIEVPNRQRELVRLREVLESDAFVQADSILTVAVGKDTYGDPVVQEISKMPHLLMAGATGTGKSVCINAFLLSLLYRATPAELGLILIDPKILELSVYEGVPHLMLPVVTRAKQARAVLEWAVHEMERRYRLMQRFGVRSIDGYNVVARGESDKANRKAKLEPGVVDLKESQLIEEGSVSATPIQSSEMPVCVEQIEPLPKIVIIIDELADLMLSAGRDVEEAITRLAQKARAAGLHLIVATQRPSVDVITGLIKANFPARLSFRVSSRIDSRTILDSMGAERLLGRGDMLIQTPGAVQIKRVHGAFVSDEEVMRVVASVSGGRRPVYDEEILEFCKRADEAGDGAGGGGDSEEVEYDEFYDRAVELVVEKGQASTSMIQRAFRIGYNRAARIVDMMERDGVIGPMDGVKPRQVLANSIDAQEEAG